MSRQPSAPQTNFPDPDQDEIVEEIHTHRAELAARFDYNLERLFRYYQELEQQNPSPRASDILGKPAISIK